MRTGERSDRRQTMDKGVRKMKAHIEYDDFGEYIEVLEEETMYWEPVPGMTEKGGLSVVKKMFQKVMLIVAAVAVMFCSSSYASETCSVKGCYRSAVSGGSYCSRHTCSKSGCRNYAAGNGYCLSHAKKSNSSGGKKFGSSGSSRYSSSKSRSYRSSGSSRSYSRSYSKTSDPYDVYDYDDPEDFYFDWEDDFEDFEDAEDYWESAW